MKKISSERLHEKMKNKEDIVLLDVRAEEKYNDYHIKDPNFESLNVFKTEILENKDDALQALSKKGEIVVTCTTGNSASKCAAVLSDKGYNVVVLDGGITAWKAYLDTKNEN